MSERNTLIENIVLRKIQLNYLQYDKKDLIQDLKFNLSLKETFELYELLELYQKEFLNDKYKKQIKCDIKNFINPN